MSTNGFIALSGIPFGNLVVTHGFGNPGYAEEEEGGASVVKTTEEIHLGPRTVISNRDAPRYNIYYPNKPKAKK